MADGTVVGSGTPREVFYDDALLERADLHPPSPVRVARDAGLDARSRPVTEADLVALLADAGRPGSFETAPADDPGHD
jgi:cobalt/nickel transport system ATP-binding protein